MRSEVEFNGVIYPVFNYGPDHKSWYTDIDGKENSYNDQMLHLDGELDLPLHLSYEKARGIAFNAAECCGYGVCWDDEKRTVSGSTDYGRSYRVTYGEQGGIINVEDITIEAKINALEGWNRTWQGRIDAINLFGLEKGDDRTAEDYQVYIDENNAKIAKLKEKMHVQDRNS